jgi:hypothetical protein
MAAYGAGMTEATPQHIADWGKVNGMFTQGGYMDMNKIDPYTRGKVVYGLISKSGVYNYWYMLC